MDIEERFDLRPKIGIVGTGGVEKGRPFFGRFLLQGLAKQGFQQLWVRIGQLFLPLTKGTTSVEPGRSTHPRGP
jgi:hypothetical protein